MSNANLSRASIYQGVYIGWEATPGTIVPPTKRLIGLTINQVPNIPIKTVKNMGAKGAVGSQTGMQFTEAKTEGAVDFNNFAYLHTMAWGASQLSSDENANVAYTRFWNPSSTQPAAPPVVASVLQGSVAGAEQFGYGFMPNFDIKWTKDELTFTGELTGQKQDRDASFTPSIKCTVTAPAAAAATAVTIGANVTDGNIPNGLYYTNLGNPINVTGGNTIAVSAADLVVTALVNALVDNEYFETIAEVPAVPADPDVWGVYISLDGATFTRLLDTMEGGITCNGMWAPVFHADDNPASSSYKTFDRIAEKQPEISATLTTEEGTEADNWMNYLENGTNVWLGVKVLGPVIDTDGATNYMWKLNIPFLVTKPDPGDKGDVYGNTFTFELCHDPEFGLFQCTLVNRLPTL